VIRLNFGTAVCIYNRYFLKNCHDLNYPGCNSLVILPKVYLMNNELSEPDHLIKDLVEIHKIFGNIFQDSCGFLTRFRTYVLFRRSRVQSWGNSKKSGYFKRLSTQVHANLRELA
jgi:hypothetical protein